MKKLTSIILLVFVGCLMFSCTEDIEFNPSVDNVQEFVFLTSTEFAANESGNSTDESAIEIHAEMLAFEPRATDVTLSLEIDEEGAVAGVDYEVVSSANEIVIPAGSLVSETGFRIKTIDNALQASGDRNLVIRIVSVTDDKLNIGRGVDNVTNDRASLSIADDECPDTIDKFDGATWSFSGSNTNYYSEYSGNYTTSVSGNTLMITGDIANYDLGITMEATFEPNGVGSTTGNITFVSSTQGSDDTYDYRWVLKSGSYDVCANTMQLVTTIQYIDIYGPDPTAWVDWYDSNIIATVESFGNVGGTGCIPSTLSGSSASGSSALTNYNSEYFYDDYNFDFTDLSLQVNDDCSTMTISGDFLDLGALLGDININFQIQRDENDDNLGILQVPTQVLGTDGGGFEYRVRSTGTSGSYDLASGTINVSLFVDYNNNGAGYVNWYTATAGMNYDPVSPGGGGCALGAFDARLADVASSFTAFNSEYYYADYSGDFTDLGISVNEDCSVITVTGDFIDLGGAIADITINFDVLSDQKLAVATQIIGDDGGGFEYRVRSTGNNGTYDLNAGTIDVELFVDYNNSGAGYVNWYTSTSSFTLK